MTNARSLRHCDSQCPIAPAIGRDTLKSARQQLARIRSRRTIDARWPPASSLRVDPVRLRKSNICPKQPCASVGVRMSGPNAMLASLGCGVRKGWEGENEI
eukprot:8219759-Pyramimonas_sp.AAC.1